jgi:hypothetical protein
VVVECFRRPYHLQAIRRVVRRPRAALVLAVLGDEDRAVEGMRDSVAVDNELGRREADAEGIAVPKGDGLDCSLWVCQVARRMAPVHADLMP